MGRAKTIATALIALLPLVLLVATQQQSTTALSLTGEQFLPNGTGIAHLDDGTMIPFNHTITPTNGFYYDNSTVFVAGEIPGFEMNETITAMNNQSGGLGSTGNMINVAIAFGSEFLGDMSFQPNKLKAKVGDVVTFKNEDWKDHRLMSPPAASNPAVSAGANFDVLLFSGHNYTIILTRPVGMHYESWGEEDMKGVVIVEQR
jgi:plastocyanin